jgi:hypothetical protein
MPESIRNVHESCYKSYHILQLAKAMMNRGDSLESVLMVIDACEKEYKTETTFCGTKSVEL